MIFLNKYVAFPFDNILALYNKTYRK